MKELIGKTIKEVQIGEDNTAIKLTTQEDEEIIISTWAECCNDVWFAHISGVDFLKDSIINEVIVKEWKQIPDSDMERHLEFEEIQFWTIKTNKGYFDFEVRNSASLSYSGDVFIVAKESNEIFLRNMKTKMRILKEDF